MIDAAQACFNEKQSCSACCGLFNLKMSDDERRAWVDENTKIFLALDISQAESIVQYRKEREAVTMPRRIRDDTYVCPFVGFTKPSKTGCLLHPQGSPHPQIGLWPHPQNFSFYGEGICLSYDCLAKERKAYRSDFFAWAESATIFQYGRLASDHTLHRALAGLSLGAVDLADFYSQVARYYQEYAVVTTSFEDVEKALPPGIQELCAYLGAKIHPEQSEAIALQLLSTISQKSEKSL